MLMAVSLYIVMKCTAVACCSMFTSTLIGNLVSYFYRNFIHAILYILAHNTDVV